MTIIKMHELEWLRLDISVTLTVKAATKTYQKMQSAEVACLIFCKNYLTKVRLVANSMYPDQTV